MIWILKNLEEFSSTEVGKSHSKQSSNHHMSDRMPPFIHLLISTIFIEYLPYPRNCVLFDDWRIHS